MVAEYDRCERRAYEHKCTDFRGNKYYEDKGCGQGFVDMDALIPEDGSNRRYRDLYECTTAKIEEGCGNCCPKFDGISVTINRSEANREGYINITADYADQAPEGCYYYKKDVKCADYQNDGCPLVVDEGTSVDLNQYYKVKTVGGCDYYGTCVSDIADCGGGKSPTAIYDETTGERINLVKESQCDNVKEEDKVVDEVCGGPYYTQCFLQTQ